MLPSDLITDIGFPSVIIVTRERALVHYDLFAISRVLPNPANQHLRGPYW